MNDAAAPTRRAVAVRFVLSEGPPLTVSAASPAPVGFRPLAGDRWRDVSIGDGVVTPEGYAYADMTLVAEADPPLPSPVPCEMPAVRVGQTVEDVRRREPCGIVIHCGIWVFSFAAVSQDCGGDE